MTEAERNAYYDGFTMGCVAANGISDETVELLDITITYTKTDDTLFEANTYVLLACTCDQISVDWGDGVIDTYNNVSYVAFAADTSSYTIAHHIYQDNSQTRTVRFFNVKQCKSIRIGTCKLYKTYNYDDGTLGWYTCAISGTVILPYASSLSSLFYDLSFSNGFDVYVDHRYATDLSFTYSGLYTGAPFTLTRIYAPRLQECSYLFRNSTLTHELSPMIDTHNVGLTNSSLNYRSDMNRMFYQSSGWSILYDYDLTHVKTLEGWCRKSSVVHVPNAVNAPMAVDCEYMFGECSLLTTVNDIILPEAIDIGHLFYNCSNLVSVGNLVFHTTQQYPPSECDAYNMFYGCTSLTTIASFDGYNITTMRQAFWRCSSLTAIDFDMNLVNCTDTGYMFYGCTQLAEIKSMNVTEATTDCSYMYALTALVSADFEHETHSCNVTRASSMFSGCNALRGVGYFEIDSLMYASRMFWGCHALSYGRFVVKNRRNTTQLNASDLLRTSNITTAPDLGALYTYCTNASYMFDSCTQMTTAHFASSGNDFQYTTNMAYMFNECTSLTSITHLHITSNVTTCECMFSETAITVFPTEDEVIQSYNVTNASKMFEDCSQLKQVKTFYFDALTNCRDMFYNCSALTTIDFQLFDPLSCPSIDASYMFDGVSNSSFVASNARMLSEFCEYVTVATCMFADNGMTVFPDEFIGKFTKVTRATQMFDACTSLTYIPALHLSSIRYIDGMCRFCPNITKVDIVIPDTVTECDAGHFFYCPSYISNPEALYPVMDTSRLTNINTMFGSRHMENADDCKAVCDIYDFSSATSAESVFIHNSNMVVYACPIKARDMSQMFYNCRNLQSVQKIDLGNATDISNMFYHCTSLSSIIFTRTTNPTTQLSLSVTDTALTEEGLIAMVNSMPIGYEASTIVVSSTLYATLQFTTLSIATAKNWTITSA